MNIVCILSSWPADRRVPSLSQCGHPIGDGIDNTVINDDALFGIFCVSISLADLSNAHSHRAKKEANFCPTIHLDGHTIYFLFKSNLIFLVCVQDFFG